MTDIEKLETLRKATAERLAYLARFMYHHECNIPEPDMDEQWGYWQAQGEVKALLKVRELLEGGAL